MKDFRENCIRVARGDTPSGRSWAGVSASGLPDDLVEKVVRRLGWVALLAILTTLLVHFLGVALFGQLAAGMKHSPLMTPSLVVMVGGSVVVLALAWSCRVPAYLMLDLGLLYEVAGALGISLLETCMPLPPPFFVRGISWVALWITVFALVIPNTPGKTALASFAAATMGPLAYLIQMAVSGHPVPDRAVFLMAFLGNYVAAVWAVLLGRVVYRLGRDVSKAREMGSYTLLEPIGKGGMGEVWRAKHRMLARTSAIKVIRPEMCHQDQQQACTMLARFHREVQATATLRSPHTVELYDFGNTDDGSFYYVMELLDGLDMERLVQRFGPLPASRVVYLLRQACASLAEAHANGLTHRDIKPKNIFVCRLGLNYDFVKVLDFGLVKVDMAKDETLTQLTRDGVTTGTPAYMAPEMALGKAVDARTDLYALGCVGYWLLTGQLVFEEDSAMAMALAHVQKAPTPPSQRTEIEVPMDLERILLWCLEKNPERRPQSARDLSMSLAACRAGEPWANERAEQWWRLHMAGSEPAPAPLDSQAVTQSM